MKNIKHNFLLLLENHNEIKKSATWKIYSCPLAIYESNQEINVTNNFHRNKVSKFP